MTENDQYSPLQPKQPLYNRALLALAVEAARYPPLANPMVVGADYSPLCGSRIALSLNIDTAGCLVDVGMKVSACAIGQAAAVIFARHALGKDARALAGARDSIMAWLADSPMSQVSQVSQANIAAMGDMGNKGNKGDMGDRARKGRELSELSELSGQDARGYCVWPEIDLLAPARAYPARHGAILLAFTSAARLLAGVCNSRPSVA